MTLRNALLSLMFGLLAPLSVPAQIVLTQSVADDPDVDPDHQVLQSLIRGVLTKSVTDDPGRDSHLPLDVTYGSLDVVRLWSERLRQARLDGLRRLVQDLQRDPDRYGLDRFTLAHLAELPLESYQFQRLVRQLLERHGGEHIRWPPLSREEQWHLQALLGRVRPPLAVEAPPPEGDGRPRPPLPDTFFKRPPVPPTLPEERPSRVTAYEQLHRWLRRFEELAGPLGRGPAWQRAWDELCRYGRSADGSPDWRHNDTLDAQLARWGEHLSRVRSWGGDLWRFRFPLELGAARPRPITEPQGAPEEAASRSPDALTDPGGGWRSGYLLVPLAIVGLAWAAWRRWGRHWFGRATTSTGSGGWPIDWGDVRSRADVVRAFECLALHRLGVAARSRHHRDVARCLAEAEPRHAVAARALADVYEQARYAPPGDVLSDEAVATARRHLQFLARVTAA
ncbi:MAG: hypothetical protein NZ700_00755 [Gemmataceae bacterium]|nr:hypothetical protein [Gemmataceae bacterium]MDW8264077.1 hypothetical protein [Gemmataceae bacterium]